MPTQIKILNKKDINSYDTPPSFTAEERKKFFYISKEIESLIKDIRERKNRVFFIISYVYLLHTSQFFDSANPKDIRFVCKALGYDTLKIDWKNYSKDTKRRHQEMLLEIQGLKRFDDGVNAGPAVEINRLLDFAETPRRIFYLLLEYLDSNTIVRPKYLVIANLISRAYEDKNRKLEAIVKSEITQEGKEALEKLLEKNESEGSGKTKYRLTQTKRISHEVKLKNIRKNIDKFHELLSIYNTVKPIFIQLNISRNAVSSFSSTVQLSDIFRLKRKRQENRNLYLIVYVAHQLFRLQDILILTLINVLKSEFNSAENDARKEYFKNKQKHDEIIDTIINSNESISVIVKRARNVLQNETMSYKLRVEKALNLLNAKSKIIEKVSENTASLSEFKEMSATAIFINKLEEKSRSITNKISPIILALTFDFESSEKEISDAVIQYRLDKGKVDETYPISILEKKYAKYINSNDGFRKNLYSVLFFNSVSKAIISGALSFHNSYDYLSLDNIQIPLEKFNKNMDTILEQCNISEFSCFNSTMKRYALEVDSSYKTINSRIIGNLNTFVSIKTDGTLKISSERNTTKGINKLNIKEKLYPDESSIPMCEVISTVNKGSGFLDELTHSSVSGVSDQDVFREIIAGIMGKGFHFGARRFSKLTDEINTGTLERVIENNFSKQKLMNANDAILRYIDQLPLADLFQNGQTSSDGQKYSISKPTLHGNRSFKYGGNKKVIAPYTFVDSRNTSFFSSIPDGAKKEAHYMLDGVINNNVVDTEMHSSDTHGYTNAVFAIAEISKINYAPRLANFQKSIRTAFKTANHYKRKGYPVLPRHKVNEAFLEKHWEQILRLVASIILGYTTSEQLFKRLNSYSKHNPLYDALVEFGLIPKTIHLLQYMDDPLYRENIQIQLNKGESLNALDRALAIGNSEYSEYDREDQSITETCKRLLKNCIVCWNYIYLSQKLVDAKTEAERKQLILRILESSAVAWAHIRIQGKFDLSDIQMSDSMNFSFSKLKNPEIVKMD